MKFRLIDAHKEEWPVRILCCALKVSVSGNSSLALPPRERAGNLLVRPALNHVLKNVPLPRCETCLLGRGAGS